MVGVTGCEPPTNALLNHLPNQVLVIVNNCLFILQKI